jgi:hypothetical protein
MIFNANCNFFNNTPKTPKEIWKLKLYHEKITNIFLTSH